MRIFFWLGPFLLVVGCVLIWIGWREHSLAATATEIPEEISLKNLIARGPGGNPNIILTDFALCDNGYVVEEKNGRWTRVWVPIVPAESGDAEAALPAPGQIKAILFSIEISSEAGIPQRLGQPKLRALVTNSITSLGGEERRLLEQSYPGTDFTRCLIVQEGREPAGPGKLIALVGGGLVQILSGAGLLVFTALRWKREQTTLRPRRRRDEYEDEEDDRPPRKSTRRRSDLD